MSAIESARGVMKALDICEASDRMFGIALSGGDYTKDLQTHITGTGLELMGARQNMVIAARAAGVQCFDTVYTDLDNMDGFRQDVETIHLMGFDGKSIINPRQIPIVQSTTFKYATSEDMGKLFDLEASGYFYSRLQNPTNDMVAAKIAEMEGGTAAMLTSSGQAANFFALFNICECGDHIVASSSIYGGTFLSLIHI